MTKVAIDAGPTHGHRTGIGNAVAWMIDALAERGDVDLERYVISMRASLSDGERRVPLPAALALRLWARPGPRLDRWLGVPDVVHGTNYVVPPSTRPRLVSVYDCWFLEHPEDAEPDVARAGAVLRRAVADGAHVVTCSDATTQRVRDVLSTDRVRTILLGPPPALHDPPGDEVLAATSTDASSPALPVGLLALLKAPYVLALGTIERRKNLPTLVAAFGRLAHEHPTVRLVMAGAPGNDVGAVDRAIARLPPEIAERVVRIGSVDEDTKAWLLTNARALAYPSLDEGFGFPILEAQQTGTPVVASAAGSIPEIAGAAALLSPARDVDALAANLYWVVTDDDMHAKLVRRGETNVERFSWDRAAEQLAATYHELADAS